MLWKKPIKFIGRSLINIETAKSEYKGLAPMKNIKIEFTDECIIPALGLAQRTVHSTRLKMETSS